MSSATTEKKTRTPRTYESIEKGALSLSLNERVALVKTISAANSKEVESLKAAAAAAEKALNGAG